MDQATSALQDLRIEAASQQQSLTQAQKSEAEEGKWRLMQGWEVLRVSFLEVEERNPACQALGEEGKEDVHQEVRDPFPEVASFPEEEHRGKAA